MPTVAVNLSTDEYVQVNNGLSPLILQCHRDSVRIVFNDVKPAKSNKAFHLLNGGDPSLQTPTDTNVWALSLSDTSSLIATEFSGLPDVPSDFEGKSPMSTVFGELTVGQRIDDVSIQFQYNNATKDVAETIIGTGAVSNSDSMAKVSTGSGVGSASLVSLNAIRYRPGHECVQMMTLIFDGNEVGVNQKGGIINTDDGFAFGYQGDVFGVWFVEGGNESFYPQSEWNNDKVDGTGATGFNLDQSKSNIYKISFGWLGIAPIYFSVYGGHSKGWILCHVIDRVNLDIEPHVQNPSLPVQIIVDRESGAGSNISVYSSSWRAGSIGAVGEGDVANRVFNYTATEIAIPSDTPTAVLVIKSKTTYQGKVNHVKAKPILLTFVTDGAKPVLIQGVVNPTYADPQPVLVDRDTVNSIMEFTEGPFEITSTIPGGVPATFMGKADNREVDAERRLVIIYPGQELAITALSTGATTVSIVATIVEEF